MCVFSSTPIFSYDMKNVASMCKETIGCALIFFQAIGSLLKLPFFKGANEVKKILKTYLNTEKTM